MKSSNSSMKEDTEKKVISHRELEINESSDDAKPLFIASFKYDLNVMLPHFPESDTKEEEMAKLKVYAKMINKQKNKKGETLDAHEDNTIIMEGPISKFIQKHHNIVRRYLVLNKHAIFVYKDEYAFKSFPNKPLVLIPLNEIAGVNQREFAAN